MQYLQRHCMAKGKAERLLAFTHMHTHTYTHTHTHLQRHSVAKGSAERVLDLIHRRTRANCGVSVARKRLRRRRRHQCVSAYLRTSEYLCVSAY